MVSGKNIYHSANEVIMQCGERFNPIEYANSKMARLYERGDIEGAIVWAEIANAILAIINNKPKGILH
jgi:hypothetical protein